MQTKLFKQQKITYMIPQEHGAWAMLLVPFLLGTAMTQANWLHIFAGLSILAGYFSMSAVFAMLRKPKKAREALPTVVVFGLLALFLGAPSFVANPFAFLPLVWMLPFMAVSVWFIRKKRERAFLHDVCVIVAFTILLPLASGLGGGATSEKLVLGMLLNISYFIGSVFYVKSAFREKNNRRFYYVGVIYHVAVLLVPVLLQAPLQFMLLYIPGVLKMLDLLRKPGYRAMQVGIVEIGNVIWFTVIAIWLVR